MNKITSQLPIHSHYTAIKFKYNMSLKLHSSITQVPVKFNMLQYFPERLITDHPATPTPR